MSGRQSRGRGGGGRGQGRGRGRGGGRNWRGGSGRGGRGGRGRRDNRDFGGNSPDEFERGPREGPLGENRDNPGQRNGGRGRGRGREGRGRVSGLKNGEKGADTHTVAESDRIRLTKILLNFRDSEEELLEFPPNFTNTERKYVHELAAQLGLNSKSTGKGENRCITVKRKDDTTKNIHGEDESLPLLKIGYKATEALRKHMQKFPPSEMELMESVETGSSLVHLHQNRDPNSSSTGDQALAERLGEMGLGSAKNTANITQNRARRVDMDRRRRYHAEAQQKKRSNQSRFQKILAKRTKLPAYAHAEEIVEAVAQNAVTIISGETGCGKSTQAPQFLLDANPEASIVVTQPRRISAIAVAERVAYEQCINENDLGGLIGYQVRLEAAVSRDTQLVFCTPGILLRKLQSDPTLSEYTHICIDEVHERDKYTEFLLIALRDLLSTRPELRLILMSATLQIETLDRYFSNYDSGPDTMISLVPAQVEMEGRTFPVQEFFLEHALQMTGYIDPSTIIEGGAVESDQLDDDLAALVGNSCVAVTATKEKTSREDFHCIMCGKRGFRDAMELGMHAAMCDSVFQESDDEENEDIPSATSNIVPVEEYDDYDVNGHAMLHTTSFQFEETKNGVSKTKQSAESEASLVDKWDGLSPFEIGQGDSDNLDGANLSSTEDALLAHYQAMHDDDQIDTALLVEVLLYIIRSSNVDGAILVFLPGWAEISEVQMILEETSPFNNRSQYLILPLHSGIPSQDQRRVLKPPPRGVRKIVLSTNISETSLTIDDIAFVVDSGRAKEKSYDPFLKTSTLQTEWISRASAKQRKGRAGRTKAGVCFHLFSARRHSSMRAFVESELLRTPLEEMCLMCKKLGLAPGGPEDDDGIPAFLAKAMSTPHQKSVTNALELLVDIGAMQPETNALTHLGECLSVVSLEPRVAKMVIWSYLLGCARTACNMGVGMSSKSPFVLPPPSKRREADNAKVRLSHESESDQITIHHVLERTDGMRSSGEFFNFCRQNYLGASTLRMIGDIRKSLSRELKSLGFPDPTRKGQYYNRCDGDRAAWYASLAAGMYPNIATRRQGDVNFSSQTNQKLKIHVSSVNSVGGQPLNSKCKAAAKDIEIMCYGEMTRGASFFTASQTTYLQSPIPLILLCGSLLAVRLQSEDGKMASLSLDDWIKYRCDAQVASHLSVIRKRLNSAFWNAVANPSKGLSALTHAERDCVEIIGHVLRNH